MKKNKVNVYDTISKCHKEIKVNDKVRSGYNRSKWNIADNDESFYKHETQFSSLIGGKDGAYENFREFITEENIVEKEVAHRMLVEKLYECLNFLPKSERELIDLLYYERKTERECAKRYGVSQKNINKKKHKILDRLNKLLKEQGIEGYQSGCFFPYTSGRK